MTNRRKWAWVTGVLTAGAAGALFYLKPGGPGEAPQTKLAAVADVAPSPAGEPAEKSPATEPASPPATPVAQAIEPPPPAAIPPRTEPASRPAENPAAEKPPVQAETPPVKLVDPPAQQPVTVTPQPAVVQPPPELPRTLTSPLAPLSNNAAPQLPAGFPRRELPAQSQAVSPGSTATPSPQETADDARRREVVRFHVVRDGDTLMKLAERYLGDPRRHAEIFAENAKLLKSPDVLPIGSKLRIVTGGAPQSLASEPGAEPAPTQPGGGELRAGMGRRPLAPVSPDAFKDRGK